VSQFSQSHTRYTLPQYKEIDTERFDYESITEDDIWKYKAHIHSGIREIDLDLYTSRILPMQPGEKPWFIAIVYRYPR
jgi:hypothetical protein